MFKYIYTFIAAFIEAWLYAWYLLEINKKNPISSSFLLAIQMFIYLALVDFMVKDMDSIKLIITFCVSYGIGNYLQVKRYNKHEKNNS